MENTDPNQSLKPMLSLLKFTFGIVPIIAGLDKFTNLLTNWEQYVSPNITNIMPFSGTTFMMIIGVIEIVVGIIVLKKPEIGGYLIAAWLTIIAVTLLMGPRFADVAVRDLVMAISAFVMARMAKFTL
jgi:hypothetical protein